MPAVLPRPARLLGVTLAAVLMLAGLALGTGPAASAAEPDPMAGAPAVGECYNLTIEEAYSPSTTKSPIACKRRHTARVIAVDIVPDRISYDDEQALRRYALRTCDPSWRSYYNVQRPSSYLTLLQGFWLQPSKDQLIAGARWISCEISLATNDALLPLPQGGPARATKKPVDSIARCTTKGLKTTVCTKKHAWRATYAFAAKARGSDKAVHTKLKKAAEKSCGRRSTTKRWVWSARYLRGATYAVACYSRSR